jgi:hypothetical protein
MTEWFEDLELAGRIERNGDQVALVDPHGAISLALGETEEDTLRSLCATRGGAL